MGFPACLLARSGKCGFRSHDIVPLVSRESDMLVLRLVWFPFLVLCTTGSSIFEFVFHRPIFFSDSTIVLWDSPQLTLVFGEEQNDGYRFLQIRVS